jgi:hypothetical protein
MSAYERNDKARTGAIQHHSASLRELPHADPQEPAIYSSGGRRQCYLGRRPPQSAVPEVVGNANILGGRISAPTFQNFLQNVRHIHHVTH